MNIEGFFSKEYIQQVLASFEEVQRTGQSKLEIPLLHKDGSLVDVLMKGVRMPDGNVIIYSQDKTEINRAQRTLQQERDNALRISNVDGAFNITLGLDGLIQKINQMGCDTLGHPKEDIIGKNWFDNYLCAEDIEFVKGVYADMMAGKVKPHLIVTNPIRGKNGEIRTILWRNAIVEDEMGNITGTLGSGIDITERERHKESLRNSLEGIFYLISAITEVRDPYTAGHQRRVAHFAKEIGVEMGLNEDLLEQIYYGGLVHDIGKISIPSEILSSPGKLSPLQRPLVQTHAKVGYEIISVVKELPWEIDLIVLQHHERMDGSGYPQGLFGDEILLPARVIGVADVVEAMTSHRPYRPALGLDVTKEEIIQGRNTKYDPIVVDACLRILDNGFDFKKMQSL
jgi:PAS domain S-box-containing protein